MSSSLSSLVSGFPEHAVSASLNCEDAWAVLGTMLRAQAEASPAAQKTKI